MTDINFKTAAAHSISPPLVPSNFAEMLQEADGLLVVMGSESLDVVAELANVLSISARGVRAWDIAEAAATVQRIASGPPPVALTGALHNLTAAVTRARSEYT